MFYKITFSNGYAGCDEEIYIKINSETEAYNYADEYLTNGWYSFSEPDDRFVGNIEDYETENDYYYEIDCYYEGVTYSLEECSEEEFLENRGEEI